MPAALAEDKPKLPGDLETNRMLDAWLRIEPDGHLNIFTGKVELGQGGVTALAQIAAEELEITLARIRMVSGDTELTPDEGHTSGSQTIEYSGSALRAACAEARAMLLDRAARKLRVPESALAIKDGEIAAPGGKRVTFAKLVEPGLFHREATAKAPPRAPKDYRIVGKSVPRFDIPAKVTGGISYVQDLRLKGMLFGRVVRPPSYRATLEALDDVPVRSMPGVITVLRDGNFLGVVAQREEQAIAAREALRKAAKWDEPADLPDQKDIFSWLRSAPQKTDVVSEKRPQNRLPDILHTVEATYTRRYVAHAPIGPSCAVATWQGDKLHVFSHTQGVFPLRRDLAKALEMPIEAIRCTYKEGSGCYGHDGADDAALDAALLARAVKGKPVKVQWMRDDEFAWEPYGSAMAMSAKGGTSSDGSIVDWQYEVWSNTHNMRPGARIGTNLVGAWLMAKPQAPSPATNIPQPSGGGDRNAVPLYDLPSQRITNHLIADMPVRVSALRTLGGYANTFASESFMDELAEAAGADPVAFRLKHLKDPRAKAVIEAVAQQADWKGGKGDGVRGRGIGFAKYKNLATYVACIAEVEVDHATGKVRVPRVWAAVDSGLIINPDGLKNQIEGGIVQGTSWTLHEEVAFDRGRITSRDWEGYPILAFPEVPTLEVALIDRPNETALGAGEASQGPTAAAIANAIANATGQRIRDLPFRPERVRAVLGVGRLTGSGNG
jgi:CO/xanthine dehydrogenase Mo-binding subunit